MSELEECWGAVIVSCFCEKLVAETGAGQEPRRRRMFANGSHYQKTGENTAG
jgi:hypothetical protein